MGLIHIIIDEETNEELFRFKSNERDRYRQNFVWFFYEPEKELFNGKLNNTDLFVIFNLATHINYNNVIMKNNLTPVTNIQELRTLSGLKKTRFDYFISVCKGEGIITKDNDGKYYISKEYFSKGKCATPKNKEKIKLYISSIRNIKLGDNNNGRKFAANIYKLIPYIGDEFNILYNKSLDCEEPMSIKDVIMKLGYSKKKDMNREKRLLLEMEFDGNKAIRTFYEKGEERVTINPKLFCMTNDVPYTPMASSQQKHIAKLLNGDLNYRINNYFLDIYLKRDKICIEYDGSGHNLSVLFGVKTKDEFSKEEKDREDFITSSGIKIIRLISKKDKLPDDTEILEIIDECKEKLLTKNIVKYNFDSMSFV